MPWKQFEFRGKDVFVRVLAEGKPIVRRGLVEIRYKKGASKSYKTARENLGDEQGEIIADAEFGGDKTKPASAKLREEPSSAPTRETIVIYTDGACSGNPGPAGIGVVIQRPDKITEISEFMGSATNNSAELTGILRGLENLSEDERKDSAIHLYTDSAWSLGVLVGGWNAKTNLQLIGKVRAVIDECPKLEMLKVKGHAGDPGNEEADYLATKAARREESSAKERPRRD
jgi:ribonuclease HI